MLFARNTYLSTWPGSSVALFLFTMLPAAENTCKETTLKLASAPQGPVQRKEGEGILNERHGATRCLTSSVAVKPL